MLNDGTRSESIRTAVLEILNDGNEHSLDELKSYIRLYNEDAVENKNLVSTILYKMMKSGLIERTRKMTYKKKNNDRIEGDVMKNIGGEAEKTKGAQSAIEGLEIASESFKDMLRPLTYGLTYEEYTYNQKVYERKKIIDDMIHEIKKEEKLKEISKS